MPVRRIHMVTIKEIASQLGVSMTTVSNVIHGKTSEVSFMQKPARRGSYDQKDEL